MVEPFPEVVLMRIEPLPGGWMLLCGDNALMQVYRSGAEAERQARSHARTLARCGYAPRLVIQDRTGRAVRARL